MMSKLNLRKARKLESKIGAFITEKQREINTTTSIRVNEDPNNIDNIINEGRQKFFDDFENLNNLVLARQEIRDLIGIANANEGINDLIANKVLLETKLSKINHFLGFNTYSKVVVEDSLELAKKGLENGDRWANTNINAPVLTQIDEDKFKTDKQGLIKDIEDLEDKLAKLNYTVEVELSSNTAKLLKDNFLI